MFGGLQSGLLTAFLQTGTRMQSRVNKKPQFTPFDEDDTYSIDMPAERIFIDTVWAEHMASPVKEGKAYIYFFVGGYAEEAVMSAWAAVPIRALRQPTLYPVTPGELYFNLGSYCQVRRPAGRRPPSSVPAA